jgi:monoamine oxidase
VEFDAIVIGAGAAGLSAARALAAQSLRVAVIEARDRTGGRAFTIPMARALTPAELGAEFIHGAGAQTLELLREDGTAAVDLDGEAWACDAGGRLRREEDDFTSAAAIFEAAESLPHDESVETFLQRFESDDFQRERSRAARRFVEGFDAADPAIASARAIAHEWRSGVDLRSARPIGGYARMFERLRVACETAGVSLLFSSAVRRIVWQRGAVTVEATGAGGPHERLEARAVVLTLPAGVLQGSAGDESVAFHPKLPSVKAQALDKIISGDVVKVALWFRTAFWEEIHSGRYRNAAFFRGEPAPFAVYWTQLPVRSELVIAWIGGPGATALRGVPPGELIERARDGFGSMLGDAARARAEFEAGFTHDWAADPYALGAYSYVAVDGEGARAVLAQPLDDTLFFAGEATSTDGQGGTVNGALESGQRAAAELMRCLQRQF